jgi:hypothetical protein
MVRNRTTRKAGILRYALVSAPLPGRYRPANGAAHSRYRRGSEGFPAAGPDGTLPFMTDVREQAHPVCEHTAQAGVCRDPVFILTASRSGSTLLRFILDTHPDFACPPETMITAACVSLLRSSDILENAGSGHNRLVTESASLPEAALDTVRDTVDRIYSRYLGRRGKPRWCDKSLDNLLNAELLAELYPQARFICLYRHCMDVIASGAECSPWGVSRFGFDPYVAEHPGNTVAAIGSYWAECARTILGFELSHPDRCHRVRYEDLVSAPEETAAGLLTFLGAAPMPGITTACFQTPHEGDGPGDEKIWFTTRVSTDTLGRGFRVPAAALPQQLREEINASLATLGYRAVTDDWNNTARPVDPRRPETIAAADGSPRRGAGHRGADGEAALAPALAAIERRIGSRSPAEVAGCVIRWPALAAQSVTLVVTDDRGISELTWTFPPGPGLAEPAGEEPVATMIAGSEVWQAVLDGRANLITELRQGRLRCLNRRDAYRLRSDEVHALAWLLGLAQVPLAHVGSAAPA